VFTYAVQLIQAVADFDIIYFRRNATHLTNEKIKLADLWFCFDFFNLLRNLFKVWLLHFRSLNKRLPKRILSLFVLIIYLVFEALEVVLH